MSQQDEIIVEGFPEHLQGKTSVFDFTMGLVNMSSNIDGCCSLIECCLHNSLALGDAIETTKKTLREHIEQINKLLAMDIDTSLALDRWQLGEIDERHNKR